MFVHFLHLNAWFTRDSLNPAQRTDGQPLPLLSLPPPPCPPLPGKGRVSSTLNWQETPPTFYHLRTSSISRWSKCWEGATAVITYGAFSPIFLRPQFFFFFLAHHSPIQRELFQVPEIRNRGASWNSRERNPGAGVRLVRTLSGVKGGKSPPPTLSLPKPHFTSHGAIQFYGQQDCVPPSSQQHSSRPPWRGKQPHRYWKVRNKEADGRIIAISHRTYPEANRLDDHVGLSFSGGRRGATAQGQPEHWGQRQAETSLPGLVL